MPLTDAAIRKIKPADKAFKVADEKGMYLLTTPSGGKLYTTKIPITAADLLMTECCRSLASTAWASSEY